VLWSSLHRVKTEDKNLHLSNNREDSSELLVDHEAKDSHHGGTSLVELDTTLLRLPLRGLLGPSEVESVTEISLELSLSGDVLHDPELKEGNEGSDLKKARGGDGVGAIDGSKTVGETSEGVAREVNVSGKVVSVTGDDLAKESKLRNTSVLELDVKEAVETLLVGVVKESKGIPESERGLGTDLTLEGVESGDGLAGLGGREGGSGGKGSGKDDRLHD